MEGRYNETAPGYVTINGKQYWCGIRILTKAEAEQHNNGLAFYAEDLKKIAADSHVKQNVRTLANNLLVVQQNKHPSAYTTIEYFAKQANEFDPTLQRKHPEKTLQLPEPARFHQGDIISYTQVLTLIYPGKHIAILNPANRKYMGGGAYIGANALEEIYFRCSDLAIAYVEHAWNRGEFTYVVCRNNTSRPNYHKEMAIGEAWFTPDVTFRQCPKPGSTSEYEILETVFSVSVIGSTAPQYHNLNEAQQDLNNEMVVKNEIRAQLTAAIEHGVDIPVLTAFGCGAFSNDPNLIAKYYWEILYQEGYANYFDHIEFAIWQDPNPSMPKNYEVFQKVFNEMHKTLMPTHPWHQFNISGFSQTKQMVFIKFNDEMSAQHFLCKMGLEYYKGIQPSDGSPSLPNPDVNRIPGQVIIRMLKNDYHNFIKEKDAFSFPSIENIQIEGSQAHPLMVKLGYIQTIVSNNEFWQEKTLSGKIPEGIKLIREALKDSSLDAEKKWNKIVTIAKRPESNSLFGGKRNELTKRFYVAIIHNDLQTILELVSLTTMKKTLKI